MVIENGDNRIAVEYDGEKWHTQDDLPNDLKRQAILERLGWKFIRIRGSVYCRDPEDTLEMLYKNLEANGIMPDFSNDNIDSDNEMKQDDTIVNQVKRRAAEIRMEWNPDFEESEVEVNDIHDEKNVVEEVNNAEEVVKVRERQDVIIKFSYNMKQDNGEQIAFTDLEEPEVEHVSLLDGLNMGNQNTIIEDAHKEDDKEFVYEEYKPKPSYVAESDLGKGIITKKDNKPTFDFRNGNKVTRNKKVQKEENKTEGKKEVTTTKKRKRDVTKV